MFRGFNRKKIISLCIECAQVQVPIVFLQQPSCAHSVLLNARMPQYFCDTHVLKSQTFSVQQSLHSQQLINCYLQILHHLINIHIIKIMYIYHVLINDLSAHLIHINLNTVFYTHIEHSPTKTIYIRYYVENAHTSLTMCVQ